MFHAASTFGAVRAPLPKMILAVPLFAGMTSAPQFAAVLQLLLAPPLSHD